MSKKSGLKYEHDIANQIHEATDSSIRTYRCGYSGNSKHSQPDILVTTPDGNVAVELKKTSQEKGFRIPEDDVRQLYECTNSYTEGYFGVKFSHRELLIFKLPTPPIEEAFMDDLLLHIPEFFNPRIGGKSNSLLLDKPSLDGWLSSQSGRDDCDVILDAIGVGPHDDEQNHTQTDVNPFDIPTTEGARA